MARRGRGKGAVFHRRDGRWEARRRLVVSQRSSCRRARFKARMKSRAQTTSLRIQAARIRRDTLSTGKS
jgi:hypothetical protein